MTEKQGGSDVRANITRAEPVGDGWYELHGHKWFCSYPPCDDLPRARAGARRASRASCVERGAGMEFQRLKDKLGTRSLPSSEVEFRGAAGAAAGRGGPRRGDDHRDGHPHPAGLRDRQRVLDAPRRGRGDLARAPPLRVRRAAGRAARDDQRPRRSGAGVRGRDGDRAAPGARLRRGRHTRLRRFATAIAKYWVCKRATPHAVEALECLGGNGYVEESPMPRLLRDAPLNGIWEGSGNVIALDVLRALSREPDGSGGVPRRVRAGARRRTRCWTRTSTRCRPTIDPWSARRAVEELALAFQASLLVRHAPAFVSDAFCAARLRRRRARLRHAARRRRRRGDRRPRARDRLSTP